MKTLLLLLVPVILCQCFSRREIQVDMVEIELVKIDTVQHYPKPVEAVLTWRDSKKVDYYSFQPLSISYILGTKMKVMVRR